MALSFPSNPGLNDSYTSGNITWTWDGTSWNIQSTGGISSTALQSVNAAINALQAGGGGLDSAAVQAIIDSNGVGGGGLDSAQVLAIAGPDSGGAIQSKLDSSLNHTNWRGSYARRARYWSVRDLNNQCDLRELYFVDPNGDRLSGTASASSNTTFGVPANAQDGNPSTTWDTAGTAQFPHWYAMDFGSPVTVATVGFLPDTVNPPSNDWGLYWSDDGTNWNLIYRANYGGSYTNNVRVDFDVSASVQGDTEYSDLVQGLDFHFGNTEWRTGGGADIIQPSADSLSAADNGKTLVWDETENKFIISAGTSGSLLLGGGVELLAEFNLAGADSAGFQIDDATHNISNYDEIWIVVYDGDKEMDLELSDDGGMSTQNITKFFDNGGTATDHTQLEWGPTTDGANALGWAVVKFHNLTGVPTMVETFGSRLSGVSQHSSAIAVVATQTDAILVAPSTGSFAAGTAYAIGYKKSRQPIEISGRLSSAWTPGDNVATYITTGVKFRAGNIGKVRLDQIPGQAITVNVLDDSGTSYASATIDSASDSATISADSDFTIRNAVILQATDSAGSATRIDMIVRGEFA